jgi:aryl-alcohol dehydrogenase-like predicted oxidoreductase
MSTPRRRLGKTDLELSPLGLGCWQFSEGQGLSGKYWPTLSEEVVETIISRSLEGGINWFDTAEAYGDGRSEQVLAHALLIVGKKPGEVVVATKWNPFGRTANTVRTTIDERLFRLTPWPIDLYQVHQPVSFSPVEAEMDAMADLVDQKKIRFVGVSNFNARRMRRAHARLEARGLALASNQVKYSLLDRRIESNGVLAAAKELGIGIIAYSPLEQGVLSGKFHDDPALLEAVKGPRGLRSAFTRRGMARAAPVVKLLQEVASAHGATPSQVALAWLVQFHGPTVFAIPGATKPKHADENVGAMRLTLSARELADLDAVSKN